jgi:hypothetical protein
MQLSRKLVLKVGDIVHVTCYENEESEAVIVGIDERVVPPAVLARQKGQLHLIEIRDITVEL